MTSVPENAPHTIDIGLDLLDRRLVDRDGRPVGKVDDVELAAEQGGPPILSAIIAGPAALAPRLGRVARWVADRRLRLLGRAEPARVPLG
jgi:hypothetical protein